MSGTPELVRYEVIDRVSVITLDRRPINVYDGLFHVHLQPLAADTQASIRTPLGRFAGRDHLITISPA